MRPATENDVERIASFNSKIFDPSVGVWTRDLLSGLHPTIREDDFSLVENLTSGEIISSLCIIKQRWLLEDICLNVGQIELVGTDEKYRGQGLIRSQLGWFSQKLEQSQCVLACVQGTPSFYKRLGYYFAIPLRGGARLYIDQIPNHHIHKDFTIRLSGQQDYPQLVRLYNLNIKSLAICSLRDVPFWSYQEMQSSDSKHAYETYVLERSGKVDGYFRLARRVINDSLIIRELVVNSYDGLVTIFSHVRELAISRGYQSITLQLSLNHPVLDFANYLGAEIRTPFGWQVRVLDWVKFFDTIKPVLERRLEQSILNMYSGECLLQLSDKKKAIRFSFELGKIDCIEYIDIEGEWHIKLTEPLLTPLVMGYRDRAELERWHLEMQTQDEARYLIDVLFPKLESYIYEYY